MSRMLVLIRYSIYENPDAVAFDEFVNRGRVYNSSKSKIKKLPALKGKRAMLEPHRDSLALRIKISLRYAKQEAVVRAAKTDGPPHAPIHTFAKTAITMTATVCYSLCSSTIFGNYGPCRR